MTILEERFELARGRILEIGSEGILPAQFRSYFVENASYLALMAEEYLWVRSGKMKAAGLEELKRHNEGCFIDLCGKNYETSYANPTYAVQRLGEDWGQLLGAVCAELHSLPAFIYEQNLEALTVRLELFLAIYRVFADAAQEGERLPEYKQIHDTFYWFASDYFEEEATRRVGELVDWEKDFAYRIIEENDLSDIRYLFYYGEFIADNQWRMAEYLAELPQDKIDAIAAVYTEGFRKGFVLADKPLAKKKSVNIRYPLGFERIVKAAVKNFKAMGLELVIYRTPSSFLGGRGVSKNGYFGESVNRQFEYDHENDQALYLDKKFVQRKLECMKAAWEDNREKAALHAGPAVIESFGEQPFSPVAKVEKLELSTQQERLAVEYRTGAGKLSKEYIDPAERSFTIIAFPIPQIGEDFPTIFDRILEVNTLDEQKYRQIQQCLIDALDKASWVRIKGNHGNRTDMKVQLHKLQDPAHETNFENCLADVNIPVGEVFTSPCLHGTEGLLHVTRVYLNGLEYRDLELTFTDGMITDYHCANFESEEENRRLLLKNILFHHETLPLGEFAIGTNTTAYVTARQYGIEDRLPILIAEKMGPHFAVGDTCYSDEEDIMTYNPDGKAIVARENEISARRREEPDSAYFHCHTDITIPYDELGELTAIAEDGTEYGIIYNGRFILEGTLDLNLVF